MENNSRRVQAEQELGIYDSKEEREILASLKKEEKRIEAKINKKLEIEKSKTYQVLKGISSVMDKYMLDPILGFIPGIGDFITSLVSLPFIYVSLIKVKSIPLTLAVIYNVLIDTLLGMIPFFVGDVLDIFVRCHIKNLRLIVGFVEDDKEVISEVNRKAFYSAIGIIIFIGLIYAMIKLVAMLVNSVSSLF